MRIKLVISLFLIAISNVFAVSTNFIIIDSLLDVEIDKLSIELKSRAVDCCQLIVNDSPLKPNIESKILEKMPQISFNINKQDSCEIVEFNLIKLIIIYENLANDDNYTFRKIEIVASAILKDDTKSTLLFNKSQRYQDTILTDEIPNIQNSIHKYDKGEIPEKKQSFFENVLQPLIFISSAIITLAILFTVRSS